jgi:hypothetical protein
MGAGQNPAPAQRSPVPVHAAHFDLVKNHIIISIEVNGSVPERFIVDTGNGLGAILMKSNAEKMSITLAPTTQISCLQSLGKGWVNSWGAASVSFGIEGKTFFTGFAIVVEAPLLEERFERNNIDGIIGSALFASFVVELDFNTQTLKLYEPKSYRYIGTGQVVRIRALGNVPVSVGRVTLPDGKTVKAKIEIDTGDGLALNLNSPFCKKHHLPGNQPLTKLERVGLCGANEDSEGYVNAVRFGEAVVQRPDTAFALPRQDISASKNFDGRVGVSFLENFKVIFDFPRNQMILEPRQGAIR